MEKLEIALFSGRSSMPSSEMRKSEGRGEDALGERLILT